MAIVNRVTGPLGRIRLPWQSRGMKTALPLMLLLAACGKQSPQPANDTQPVAPVAKPPQPTTKPFVYDEKNDLIDYHVAWSAEAAAVPQLVEQFRAAMEKDKAELL